MTGYVLHYAPDNASLIVRLVLEELRLPYATRLVDRATRAQDGATFKAVNPVGRIPALETETGPIFETAAIALWLADRHGGLAPALDDPCRGRFLSWLFFLSNTVHAELRTLFYPARSVGSDPVAQATLLAHIQANLTDFFGLLDTECRRATVLGAQAPTICDLYTVALLRWPALYPLDTGRAWFQLGRWPALQRLARSIESRPGALRVAHAEGLGPTPFSAPHLPNPPEGSAL